MVHFDSLARSSLRSTDYEHVSDSALAPRTREIIDRHYVGSTVDRPTCRFHDSRPEVDSSFSQRVCRSVTLMGERGRLGYANE